MPQTEIDKDQVSLILKLLGNKTGLAIIKLMEGGACCVCEFVEVFQVSQQSISQDFRKLKDLRLVEEARKGIYSLNKNSKYCSFITLLFAQLSSQDYKLKQLEDNGTRVFCLNCNIKLVT